MFLFYYVIHNTSIHIRCRVNRGRTGQSLTHLFFREREQLASPNYCVTLKEVSSILQAHSTQSQTRPINDRDYAIPVRETSLARQHLFIALLRNKRSQDEGDRLLQTGLRYQPGRTALGLRSPQARRVESAHPNERFNSPTRPVRTQNPKPPK